MADTFPHLSPLFSLLPFLPPRTSCACCRCDFATIEADPLDETPPAEAHKRATATNAFLRALSVRLTHFKHISLASGSRLRPSFDPGYKATEDDFREFAQSGLGLIGVDSDSAFVTLSLGRDLLNR